MKKLTTLTIFIFTILFSYSVIAQQKESEKFALKENAISPKKTISYVYEDFEGESFPPPGWTLEFTGTMIQYWMRYKGASAYGKGTASALFQFSLAQPGITQSLVLSSTGASVAGDSLQFDHAYASYSGENDRLIIQTSADGGTTYSTLVTLNGGKSGQLVTAPPNTGNFVPTATQWKTKHYALPVGTNRIRFKASSAWGNNLYLDNITIGNQSDIDVGTQSIDVPDPMATWTWTPKVTVCNYGSTPQTFQVTLMIFPDGYSSTKTVTALPDNTNLEVSFENWTPIEGAHNLTAFTTLAGDMDLSNDTLRSEVSVNGSRQVGNIYALSKNGQVFVTWDNLTMKNVIYTLYKSENPIRYGFQLSSAQNLGTVPDNSAFDERLTQLLGPTYLRIDSASSPLTSNKGLFVATSTEPGSFYYAVTANVGEAEDTTIVVGSNSIDSPVNENVQFPQPIWQTRTSILWGKKADIYAQFATKVTSPIYPQMTNADSYPFHFALIKSGGNAPHPLTFVLHASNTSFLNPGLTSGIDAPNEWVITVDDWIPNPQAITYFYGYHEDYNIRSNQNQIPYSGIIHNYTSARINYTLDWAVRNLPVDSTRVYMCGLSMGAIGTLLNALVIPKRIAAFFVYVPRIDMSDWGFNEQWGMPATNLMTNEGYSRKDRLNATFLAGLHKSSYIPIMYIFSGKKDVNVGWDDKPPFYDSMNSYRLGGFYFWSNTDHYTTYPGPWVSSFPNFSFFTRYRSNLSYPAFSNCSINYNPGNGSPSNGDPIGSINGHLDWNDDIVDLNNRWEITLFLKDLKTSFGSDAAPDSATTDVTLRRLQAFSVPAGTQINWVNHRNNVVVQHGAIAYDSGLVTITGVKVYKDSSRLIVNYGLVSVDNQKVLPAKFALMQNYPNPFNPTTKISWQSPVGSRQSLKVYDILGREIATLVDEYRPAGRYEVVFSANNLPSGVYFYKLKAGEFIQTKKMILLR